MLNQFEKAKLSSLLPEIAQRTGISYPKLAALLICNDVKEEKSYGPGEVIIRPINDVTLEGEFVESPGWGYECSNFPPGFYNPPYKAGDPTKPIIKVDYNGLDYQEFLTLKEYRLDQSGYDKLK